MSAEKPTDAPREVASTVKSIKSYSDLQRAWSRSPMGSWAAGSTCVLASCCLCHTDYKYSSRFRGRWYQRCGRPVSRHQHRPSFSRPSLPARGMTQRSLAYVLTGGADISQHKEVSCAGSSQETNISDYENGSGLASGMLHLSFNTLTQPAWSAAYLLVHGKSAIKSYRPIPIAMATLSAANMVMYGQDYFGY